MLRATKVRIYPTQEQADFLIGQFGAVRFAYNKALHLKKHYYSVKGVQLKPTKDIKPLLSVAKNSRKYSWLGDYDSIALQQSIINLDGAFKRFFDPKLKAGFPKFKSKHGKQSSYHCTSLKVNSDSIKIPKLKQPIKANIHREIIGKVKSITLSLSVTGKFYASILVDDGVTPVKLTKIEASKVTGIDLGLSHFLIKSDGSKVANQRFIKRAERNLKRKQRQLSRKQKGSRNRAKSRLLVAKCHERTANARNDFQHKLSKQIIDESQAVIVETLKVKNMLKNSRLSKSISDVSWSSFVTKLEYKALEQGKTIVKLDRWYASSKTCSCCGHKVDKMPLSTRFWSCPECNANHDRDINAAINIKHKGITELKAAGLTVSACGGLRKSAFTAVAA